MWLTVLNNTPFEFTLTNLNCRISSYLATIMYVAFYYVFYVFQSSRKAATYNKPVFIIYYYGIHISMRIRHLGAPWTRKIHLLINSWSLEAIEKKKRSSAYVGKNCLAPLTLGPSGPQKTRYASMPLLNALFRSLNLAHVTPSRNQVSVQTIRLITVLFQT